MSAKTQTVAALCRLLSRGDEADRCYAARALGILQDSAALPALIEYLHDEDPDVCIDAAEALGRIRSPEAIPALLDLLHNHPDGEARTAAVEALGNIPDPRVKNTLIAVATKRPENLAWDDEWDDWWDMQLHAVKALGRMRAVEAIPVLQYILEDEESQGIETEILTALAHIGGKGLKILEQRLVNGTARQRRRTATILGHSGNKEAIPLLNHALLDEDTDVRSAGLRALGNSNATSYLKVVLVSLKDPEAEVRNAAIETGTLLASGTSRNDGIADQIIPLLKDRNPLVRTTAIKSLATLTSKNPPVPGMVEKICMGLNDHDTTVATAACHFLAQHRTPQAKNHLLQIVADRKKGTYIRQQAIYALGTNGDPSEEILDTLANAITDKEQLIRLESLTTLVKLAESDTPDADSALKTVINVLHGRLEKKTDSTAKNVLQNTAPASHETLHKQKNRTKHSHDKGRKPATSTLESVSNNNIEPWTGETTILTENPPCQNAPDTPDEQLSELQEYIELAEKNVSPSTEKRIAVTSDVRILSARVLANSNSEKTITALLECLESDEPGLCREAAISIGKIASHTANTATLKNTLEPLLEQLETGGEEMRHTCTRALAKLGCAEAFPHLIGALKDKVTQVRIEAINGLVELSATPDNHHMTEAVSPTEILKQVQACLKDPASGVRLAAAKGLASLLSRVDRKLFEKSVIESIVTAARSDNGARTREMGRILKEINTEASTNLLLEQLDTLQSSGERRFVIELLEEILAPEQGKVHSV